MPTEWLFAQGHAVDVILLVMAGELAWLWRVSRWTASAATLRLLPGALMLLALRAALTGMTWPWIAVALLLSFPAHLADLARSR